MSSDVMDLGAMMPPRLREAYVMLKNQLLRRLACYAFFVAGVSTLAQCPSLVWSDEFSDSAVNEANWSYQVGGSGWGNNEWQYYQPDNATVSDGTLKITAREEAVGSNNYTSTRMHSVGKADFTYGRFEARIKMSYGQGIWPAFWMMPTDNTYGTWPRSGEIDIMENIGRELSTTHGTIHYGNPNHQFRGQSFQLFGGQQFADEFHVFAVEKEPHEIRWYVDNIHFLTLTPDDISPDFWPFEERYHFILNLAVGGNWPGYPDATTVFPQVLEVDYVRVYDMGFPSIGGNRNLPSQATAQTYVVEKAPVDTNYKWTVPSGATILAGQGTGAITVDWGLIGGDVKVDLTNVCGSSQMTIPVFVNPPYDRAFSFENFDEDGELSITNMDGVLTQVSNPDPSGLNPSAISGHYIRNGQVQYDVIAYRTTAIPDGTEYVSGERGFVVDIYTTAPVGSEILLQLENSTLALPSNYPTGRHSRYQAFTTVQGGWERIEIPYLDSPDVSTSGSSVDTIVLLFAPNTLTGDTWIFDNLDSYVLGDATALPVPPDGLQVEALSASEIELTWNDNARLASGFLIERSTDGTQFDEITHLPANSTGYTDTELLANTTYYYRLKAMNQNGNSDYTQIVSTTTAAGSGTFFLSSVIAGAIGVGKGQRQGTVWVNVVDTQGLPVSGVRVVGTFSSDFDNSAVSGETDTSGVAILKTENLTRGQAFFSFCVTGATHAELAYDDTQNQSTCGLFSPLFTVQ